MGLWLCGEGCGGVGVWSCRREESCMYIRRCGDAGRWVINRFHRTPIIVTLSERGTLLTIMRRSIAVAPFIETLLLTGWSMWGFLCVNTMRPCSSHSPTHSKHNRSVSSLTSSVRSLMVNVPFAFGAPPPPHVDKKLQYWCNLCKIRAALNYEELFSKTR